VRYFSPVNNKNYNFSKGQKDHTNYQNGALRPFYLIYKTLKIVTIVMSCSFVLKFQDKFVKNRTTFLRSLSANNQSTMSKQVVSDAESKTSWKLKKCNKQKIQRFFLVNTIYFTHIAEYLDICDSCYQDNIHFTHTAEY